MMRPQGDVLAVHEISDFGHQLLAQHRRSASTASDRCGFLDEPLGGLRPFSPSPPGATWGDGSTRRSGVQIVLASNAD
jgi:hypothetical protein